MKLHEKIKFLRQMKGWSQSEIAERIGMSANGYGNIERGDTNISIFRLEKIAEVLETDLEELMSFSPQIIHNKVCDYMGDNNRNYQFIGDTEFIQMELKHELEKRDLLLIEREKEIVYLKSVIDELLKKLNNS
jgi:transcriptional regulator with XRE-family HTH domain